MHAEDFDTFLRKVFASPDLSQLQAFYREAKDWLPTEDDAAADGTHRQGLAAAARMTQRTPPSNRVVGAGETAAPHGIGAGVARLTDRRVKSNRTAWSTVQPAEAHGKGVCGADDSEDGDEDDEGWMDSETLEMICADAAGALSGTPVNALTLQACHRLGKPTERQGQEWTGCSQLVAGSHTGLRDVGQLWMLVDEVDGWMNQSRARQEHIAASAATVPVPASLAMAHEHNPTGSAAVVDAVTVTSLKGLTGARGHVMAIRTTMDNLCVCTASRETVSVGRVVREEPSGKNRTARVAAVEMASVLHAADVCLPGVEGDRRDDAARGQAVVTCVAAAPPYGEMARFPSMAVAVSWLPLDCMGEAGEPIRDRQPSASVPRVTRGQSTNMKTSSATDAAAPSAVTVFDVLSQHFRPVTSASFLGETTAMCFSDGACLVTGGVDGTVRVWHALATQTQLAPLISFPGSLEGGAVTALTCVPSNTPASSSRSSLILAVGCEDGTVHVCDGLRAQTLWMQKPVAAAVPLTDFLSSTCRHRRSNNLSVSGSATTLKQGIDREGGYATEKHGTLASLPAAECSPEAIRSLSVNADGMLLLAVTVAGALLLNVEEGSVLHVFRPDDLLSRNIGKKEPLRTRHADISTSVRREPDSLLGVSAGQAGRPLKPNGQMLQDDLTDGAHGCAGTPRATADLPGMRPPSAAVGPTVNDSSSSASPASASEREKKAPRSVKLDAGGAGGNADGGRCSPSSAVIQNHFTHGLFVPQPSLPHHLFFCMSDGSVGLFVVGRRDGVAALTAAPVVPSREERDGDDEGDAMPAFAPLCCQEVWAGHLASGIVACSAYVGGVMHDELEEMCDANGSPVKRPFLEGGVVACDLRGNVTSINVRSHLPRPPEV